MSDWEIAQNIHHNAPWIEVEDAWKVIHADSMISHNYRINTRQSRAEKEED